MDITIGKNKAVCEKIIFSFNIILSKRTKFSIAFYKPMTFEEFRDKLKVKK